MAARCSKRCPSDRPWPAVCSSSTFVWRRGRALNAARIASAISATPSAFGALRARAGVDDDTEEGERVRAIQLVDQGRYRLLAEDWDPGRQIDQVACV